MVKKQYTFKVLFIGDGGVGKTTFALKLINGEFVANTKITIGIEFHLYRYCTDEDTEILLHIWDFGGVKRFRFMFPAFSRGAHGAIFFGDGSRMYTFKSIGEWMGLVRHHVGNIPVVLVVNKIDLDEHVLPNNFFSEMMDRYQFVGMFSTSAKTGENVKEAVECLCKFMMDAYEHGSRNTEKA